jgi:hypothetical protein
MCAAIDTPPPGFHDSSKSEYWQKIRYHHSKVLAKWAYLEQNTKKDEKHSIALTKLQLQIIF